MSKKHGFTLAEILITLTVIGVVAALTIPTLLQNTNQAELKAAWKKDFADIRQAAMLITNDNGGSYLGLCSTTGSLEGSVCYKNLFANKLNYIKSCETTEQTYGNCWSKLGAFKFLNGDIVPSMYTFAYIPSLILNNGSFVTFTNYDSTDGIYTVIQVDVN